MIVTYGNLNMVSVRMSVCLSVCVFTIGAHILWTELDRGAQHRGFFLNWGDAQTWLGQLPAAMFV